MRKGKRCDLAFEKEHFPAKVGSQRNFVSNNYIIFLDTKFY